MSIENNAQNIESIQNDYTNALKKWSEYNQNVNFYKSYIWVWTEQLLNKDTWIIYGENISLQFSPDSKAQDTWIKTSELNNAISNRNLWQLQKFVLKIKAVEQEALSTKNEQEQSKQEQVAAQHKVIEQIHTAEETEAKIDSIIDTTKWKIFWLLAKTNDYISSFSLFDEWDSDKNEETKKQETKEEPKQIPQEKEQIVKKSEQKTQTFNRAMYAGTIYWDRRPLFNTNKEEYKNQWSAMASFKKWRRI